MYTGKTGVGRGPYICSQSGMRLYGRLGGRDGTAKSIHRAVRGMVRYRSFVLFAALAAATLVSQPVVLPRVRAVTAVF